MSYFDFVGEFSRDRWTVAVSGTNGKSTTTALLGLMLEAGDLEPTVIVGSKVASFPDKNLRLGRGEHFVIEACEHNANMLKLFPQMIVLTNVEEDHLDFYRDLAHIRDTFQRYLDKLPPDGTVVLNADDHVSFAELKPTTSFVTYGMDNPADYVARDLKAGGGKQTFSILRTIGHEESLGEFEIKVPGKFNVMNALAAATAAFELGVSADVVRRVLAEFPGIWRRFERVGLRGDALIISDYGHHPTAIRQTLEGARDFFVGQRIVLCFQPHQRNRTRKLFGEFVASFDGADALVLCEVFDVTGREEAEDAGVSSKQLAEAVRERDETHGKTREVSYASSPEDAKTTLEGMVRPGDVVIVMGAGDIYTIAPRLATL
jgi:UDP-N-acetylmuramate--alanine ligase